MVEKSIFLFTNNKIIIIMIIVAAIFVALSLTDKDGTPHFTT